MVFCCKSFRCRFTKGLDTVKVHIEFFGLPILTNIVGAVHEIEFEGNTLKDLIAQLTRRYGTGVERVLVDDEKRLNPYILAVINEELIVGHEERSEVRLTEGDRVIFTIMAGGG